MRYFVRYSKKFKIKSKKNYEIQRLRNLCPPVFLETMNFPAKYFMEKKENFKKLFRDDLLKNLFF